MKLRTALIGCGLALAGCGTTQLQARSDASPRRGSTAADAAAAAGCSRAAASAHPSVRAASSGAWGVPRTLVPAGTAAASLGLAATPDGSLLAGWVQGPPPMVSIGGPAVPAGRTATTNMPPTTQSVQVATGTFASGFAPAVQLTSGRSGPLTNLQATVSSPNVGYVAWEQTPGPTLRVGVICNGKVAVRDRQLRAHAVPLELFPLSGGRAALVFDQYGHGTPLLDYGVLTPKGMLGRVATIAHPGTSDTAATEFSVNARGELIAAWVHDDLSALPGSSRSSPTYKTAQLMLAVCKPALHCAAPEGVQLGNAKPVCINPAVAIAPDGSTTVIAAASGSDATGCDVPLGVWAAVTHSAPRAMRRIEANGDFPVAEPVGRAGTVVALNPGRPRANSFGWSVVSSTGSAPARATLLDRGGWWNTGQTPLSPANNGWYLLTWTHANRHSNPNLSLRAAVGHGGRVQRAAVVLGAKTHIAAHLGVTDGRGDAIILFSGSTDTGNGAAYPYSSGLYTTALAR
jgi:hypothetical protein